MSKQYVPLGNNILIKVKAIELEKIGSIAIPVEMTKQAKDAGEEAEILALGENAFLDLEPQNRPKVGDFVALPRYEGTKVGRNIEDVFKETKKDEELKIVQDARVIALIKN